VSRDGEAERMKMSKPKDSADQSQFFFFAAVNIISACLCTLLPETKGVSLEEMDVIFGSVTREERDAEIAARAHEMHVDEKVGQPEHVERSGDKV